MPFNEATIIEYFKNAFPSEKTEVIGIGDDTALLNNNLLITKDLLVENTHFRLSYFSPQALAHKALQVNLSDIAAMGGQAKYLLLGLGIPKNLNSKWLTEFLTHFTLLCEKNKVILIGGDTTVSSEQFFISITMIGEKINLIKLRSMAKANDIICVTGPLGDALAGLMALENNDLDHAKLKNKQLMPNAKIEQGLFFSEKIEVHAMMDLSDGLYLDLPKLCNAANVGAHIDSDKIPISSDFKLFFCYCNQEEIIKNAISGGEDYELLVSIRPDVVEKIQADYELKFGEKLYSIGKLTHEKNINYFFHGKPVELILNPFEHFKF